MKRELRGSRLQHVQDLCDFVKVFNGQWVNAYSASEALGWKLARTREWIRETTAQGILIGRPGARPEPTEEADRPRGPTPAEFTLLIDAAPAPAGYVALRRKLQRQVASLQQGLESLRAELGALR